MRPGCSAGRMLYDLKEKGLEPDLGLSGSMSVTVGTVRNHVRLI